MASVAFRTLVLAVGGALVASVLGPACSSTVQGSGDAQGTGALGGGGGTGSGGTLVAGNAGLGAGAATSPGGAGSGGTPSTFEPTCEEIAAPDDAVFVHASDGNDDGNDQGSNLLPLKTIGKALSVASALGASDIVVAHGTYAESLELTTAHDGLTISGGFVRSGTTWTRDCDGPWVSKTLLAPAAPIALRFTGVTDTVELSGLTVATKPNGASVAGTDGESLYALWAEASSVRLRNVEVIAGRGGDGGSATPGANGGNSTCDGVASCSAAPAVGAAGTAVGPSASPGTFSAAGFVPSAGPPGNAGQPGDHGSAGPAGTSESNCSYPNTACCGAAGSCCPCGALLTVTGEKGKCGCGGLGGGAGGRGRGGGASVGIFAVGSSTTVALIDSRVESSDGGDGSLGAEGGNGGPGSAGSQGSNVGCQRYDCGSAVALGGPAGTAGRPGGKGSTGGAGAGGSSYALVRVSGATFVKSGETEVVAGAPGAGAGSASAGEAGTELTVN